MLGVIDLNDPKAETPEVVAGRLRAALKHVPAERLIVAPDCGMKYLPRDVAFAKLKAMADGAAIARNELKRSQGPAHLPRAAPRPAPGARPHCPRHTTPP